MGRVVGLDWLKNFTGRTQCPWGLPLKSPLYILPLAWAEKLGLLYARLVKGPLSGVPPWPRKGPVCRQISSALEALVNVADFSDLAFKRASNPSPNRVFFTS